MLQSSTELHQCVHKRVDYRSVHNEGFRWLFQVGCTVKEGGMDKMGAMMQLLALTTPPESFPGNTIMASSEWRTSNPPILHHFWPG